MGKYLIGWLLGVPMIVLVVIYLLNNVIQKNDDLTAIMTPTLGVALILTAISLIFRGKLVHRGHDSALQRKTHHERFGRWQNVLTVLTGLVLGVLVTLTSVGAGALGTITLLFLYPPPF